MIDSITIGRPYAKAVFELATLKHQVLEWGQALLVLSIAMQNSCILSLLKTNALTDQEIVSFLLDVCKACKINLGVQLNHFLLLLCEKKRLIVLPQIQVHYKKLQMMFEDKIEVKFETAIELDEKQKERYEALLSKYFKRSAILDYHVNQQLLGGFLAKAGYCVVDGSLKGTLTTLESVMGD